MGLDLWFQEDVARILASVHETMLASTGAVSGAASEETREYQQGFLDSLHAVGVAFGVRPLHPPPPDNGSQHVHVVDTGQPRLPSSWAANSSLNGGNST